MIMRLVPILFFLSLVFLVVVGSVASVHAKLSSDQRDNLLGGIEVLKTEIEQTKAKRTALESQISQALDLENWVLASMPLQPLVVAITRSLGPGSELVDLTLERDSETPWQLRLGLKLNAGSDDQLQEILNVIQSMNYKEFNPTQTRVQGNLDYKASLLWQDPGGERRRPPQQ